MEVGLHLDDIEKMYAHLTYFDQYSGSVLLVLFITLVFIVVAVYCSIQINAQPIIQDWPNQRCKPYILPIAGFITHPEDTSALDYTYQNFTYCTQNILSSIGGLAVEPITFITNGLQQTASQISGDIQNIRAMFDKVRTFFQEVIQEIMGRVLNVTIPLQQIVISFKDLMGKIQGTMTTGLFTLLGSYYTLQSTMGAIAQMIVSILITLAIIIGVLWLTPFTWGFAMTNTVIFTALAIPMSIILAFMVDVLHVKTGLTIPTLKCFDKDTLLKMHDGGQKKICDIVVGNRLFKEGEEGGNEVTACIRVTTEGSDMYWLDNQVLVSDSHLVYHRESNRWIPVSEHPAAVPCTEYDQPYLYCLNTRDKTICIGGHTFTDWNEEVIMASSTTPPTNKTIHGFPGDTRIQTMQCMKYIRDVQIGDVLEHGEIVYGVVGLKGNRYHLLTNTGYFYVEQSCILDYNQGL
jgi:hypothetical protein